MPRDPIADVTQAFNEGRIADVEAMARRALALVPGQEILTAYLGVSLQVQRRPAEAAQVFRELTDRFPRVSGYWNNLGTALREMGQLAEAGQAYSRALALTPGDPNVIANIGFLCMERADFVSARRYLLDAVRRAPDDIELRINAATMCYECGDNPAAERLLDGWQSWSLLSAELRLDLGWILMQLGNMDDSERLLRQALEQAVQVDRVRARLVILLERVNRVEEARSLLELLPDPAEIGDISVRREIINARSVMAVRSAQPRESREELGRLIGMVEQVSQRPGLYFGLAKVCDQEGDTAAAMDALRLGHEAQMETAAQLVPELVPADVEPLKFAQDRLLPSEYERWRGSQAPEVRRSPIFVVGFPRSGTTMLEQMLDAHPELRSMDERSFIQGVVERFERLGLAYPNGLGDLDEATCERLRREYWAMVEHVVQLDGSLRLVDKNPLNLLRLPMINRLFPNARIILALRHPCDVVLSCYMQNFRSPAFQVLCSTLQRLARGYVNAMKSWIYHQNLLKPTVLVVRYEDMLAEFDVHVERIGEFLDLRDARPMLDFDRHARSKGFISTPSYSQVVRRPNTSAMGRWRRYSEYLEPVMPILQPILDHWGYTR